METIKGIEKELKELYPKKELAYIDYQDNSGGERELKKQLWDEFVEYRDRWNELVNQRKKLLKG